MVHECGVGPVEVKRVPKNITRHSPSFFVQASCGRVVPKTPPTLLRLRKLKMTTWSVFQGLAGVDDCTAELGSYYALETKGVGVGLEFF